MPLTRRAAALILTFALSLAASAQSKPIPSITDNEQWVKDAGGPRSFEVVSVKQNTRPISRDNLPYHNFPWTSTPTYVPTGGRFVAKNVTVEDVIALAYKLTGQQTKYQLHPILPAWALDEHFDIEAHAPDGPEPTKDQMRLMIQALLADRFQLKLHYETREGTIHVLRLVQPGVLGPSIRKHPADVDCSHTWYTPNSDGSMPSQPTDGLPAICTTVEMMKPPVDSLSYAGRGTAIAELVKMSAAWYDDGRPVIDETGLAGVYDFTLEFSPPSNAPPQLPANPGVPTRPDMPARPSFINQHGVYGPELVKALRTQLGMKLENTKGPVQSLVLDHIEQPSAN